MLDGPNCLITGQVDTQGLRKGRDMFSSKGAEQDKRQQGKVVLSTISVLLCLIFLLFVIFLSSPLTKFVADTGPALAATQPVSTVTEGDDTPTVTGTPVPPTATATPVPPTATATLSREEIVNAIREIIDNESAKTATPVPPTATSTPVPPTATAAASNSQPKQSTATPSEPGRPPSAPRNLLLTPGDKRIEVSWDEPEELGKPAIDTYYVGFRKAGTTSWVYVGRTNTSVTLEGLENGVEYEVRVSVSNSQGDAIAGPKRATPASADSGGGQSDGQGDDQEGEEEPEPSDTPTVPPTATPTPTAAPSGPDRPPSAPRNLLLTPGDKRIEVSWDEPEELGKPAIDTYYAGFRKAGTTSWVYVGRTNTSVTLEGLENGVEYEVQVSVSNSQGDAIAGPKRATPNPPTATPEPTPTSPPDSLEGVTPHTPTPVPPTATATPTDHPVIIIEEAPTATPGPPAATPTATPTDL